mmetsp:Transcript_25642/g.36165  ORF Transcript_25642/g.36165 Transcript_25642/m.36165 type:complete len:438 (-) Transcript_25642:2086-3399(-)
MILWSSQSSFTNKKFFIIFYLYSYLLVTASHALVAVPPPAVVHIAIGFVAGSSGAIAAYPFDYVKSQLQTEKGRTKWNNGWEAACDIVQTEKGGPFALYRGVMVNIIGVAPEKTIKLGVNSYLRNMFLTTIMNSHTSGYVSVLPLMLFGEMMAGGIAGMTQVIVTNPLEVIKVRMQTSEMTLQEVLQQMKSIGDVYEGVEACVIRDSMFSATLFPLYAHAKVAIATALMGSMGAAGDATVVASTATFWANLIAGSVAAAPAAFIATPADVIKTRMQQAKKTQTQEEVETGQKEDLTVVDMVSMSTTATTSKASSSGAPATSTSSWQRQPQVMKKRVVSYSTTLNYERSIPPSSSKLLQSNSSSEYISATASIAEGRSSSFLKVASNIVTNEGPMVLLSGWAERVVRSVPQFGVTLAVFDVLTTLAIERGLLPLETLS